MWLKLTAKTKQNRFKLEGSDFRVLCCPADTPYCRVSIDTMAVGCNCAEVEAERLRSIHAARQLCHTESSLHWSTESTDVWTPFPEFNNNKQYCPILTYVSILLVLFVCAHCLQTTVDRIWIQWLSMFRRREWILEASETVTKASTHHLQMLKLTTHCLPLIKNDRFNLKWVQQSVHVLNHLTPLDWRQCKSPQTQSAVHSLTGN